MWHFHSATCHRLPGPTWTTPASSPATPPLAPAGGASPPCNSPLDSRGGHWGPGVSKPPRPQVGWGSVAGHTTRQWTELERTLVEGKGVNTRPLRGRGLWAETQDAHALHGSPRGDASDPAEPREKSVPLQDLSTTAMTITLSLHTPRLRRKTECPVPHGARWRRRAELFETRVPSLRPSEPWKPHSWEPGPRGVLTQTRPSVQPQQWPSSKHRCHPPSSRSSTQSPAALGLNTISTNPSGGY